MGAQYAIMRFAKYKGPEISGIEAHNERTKEKYASNPDVDTSRSHLNFHLIEPQGKYRAEAEKQIAAAGCRTRTDSVRLVEMLVTASPEFFKDKKREEIRTFFQTALDFIKQKQNPDTIISAVVHMDEKTPHMHLSFVPLTDDGRLCAKEIIGNKKKLTQWQDAFWEMLSQVSMFNAKAKAAEICRYLDKYIPNVEKMSTQMKKYKGAFQDLTAENEALVRKNERLTAALKESRQESVLKRMADLQLQRDYEQAVALLERIPPEILEHYAGRSKVQRHLREQGR